MDRQIRYFAPLSRAKPFQIATYDIETKGIEDLSLEMIGFYDGTNYSVFRRVEDFLDYVLVPQYAGWRIFAHYGGRFDANFLFDTLRHRFKPGGPWSVSIIAAGSAVIALTVSNKQSKRTWRFCDSFRLMPASLRELCRTFNTATQKLEFDPSSIEYNRADCVGLHEVLTAFFDMYSITSETVAAHTMRVFRSRYLDRWLPIPSRDVEELARSAYTGGRCEIYRWDSRKVKKFDVNSLYPWAMLGPVPVEYITRSRMIPDDDRRIGFYEAEIDYPEVYLPALPVRSDKLYFPVGKFSGSFTSMELRRAIEHGASVRVKRGAIFKAEPLLADYVKDLYALKLKAEKTGDSAWRYVSKLLMNSCYGKFGESREKRTVMLDPGTPRLRGDSGPPLYPIEGTDYVFYFDESRSTHILPHIAACITARARLKILDYFDKAVETGRIWYGDTDSVFTSVSIETGTGLGEMKLEGEGKFQAHGLKEYIFDGKPALKGVPLTRTDPVTGKRSEDFTLADKYLAGDEIEFERMAGMIESLRKGLASVRRVKVTRCSNHPREKRARVGNDTRPWRFEEI